MTHTHTHTKYAKSIDSHTQKPTHSKTLSHANTHRQATQYTHKRTWNTHTHTHKTQTHIHQQAHMEHKLKHKNTIIQTFLHTQTHTHIHTHTHKHCFPKSLGLTEMLCCMEKNQCLD